MNIQAEYLVLKNLIEGQDTLAFGRYSHDIIYRLINISLCAQQNAEYKYRSRQSTNFRQEVYFNDDDILSLIEQAINKGANESHLELGTAGQYAFDQGRDKIATYLLKSSGEIVDPHIFVQLCVTKSMFLLLHKFLSLLESVPPANQETLLPSILNIFISHVNKERSDYAASAVTKKNVFQLIEVAIQKGALCNIVIDPALKECPNSPLAVAFFLDCQDIVELLMTNWCRGRVSRYQI
jgi:hypothetical protein